MNSFWRLIIIIEYNYHPSLSIYIVSFIVQMDVPARRISGSHLRCLEWNRWVSISLKCLDERINLIDVGMLLSFRCDYRLVAGVGGGVRGGVGVMTKRRNFNLIEGIEWINYCKWNDLLQIVINVELLLFSFFLF